jgi:uracil-DNA glycosylase
MIMQKLLWDASLEGSNRLSHWPPDAQGRMPSAPNAQPLSEEWQAIWQSFAQSEAGLGLNAFVTQQLAAGAVIYPSDPLRALRLTPLRDVKVLILGQDPYHGPGQAEGLAFSVAPGIKIPPSLRNIVQEVRRYVGLDAPANGSLTAWAQRGVLLINTSWTVEQGQAGSHAGKGWDALTDEVIQSVTTFSPLCVYMLWGAHAQSKTLAIEKTATQSGQQCLVLQANHPSPLSARRGTRPFVGCGHFSLAQSWLRERGVNWRWDWALTPQGAA